MAFFFFFFLLSPLVLAQNTPVPPLQWINLSNLLQGSSRPPPLRDAAMGYDETSRSLIIFGGLSESGFPQSQTFLLNLDTLVWSIPSPPPALQSSPPARSAVICGGDFAASNRHGFVVIGGKDVEGNPLSDIWEYDFINQFWSQVSVTPGGPSARWGASGGIDTRTPPIQDPVIAGPNNSFYLAGGFDGTSTDSLSDVWRLNISGTLSSNLPNNVNGTWDHFAIGNLSGRIDQAGTVIAQEIVVSSGCNLTTPPLNVSTSCATQDSFVLDVQHNFSISPLPCPAPRLGAVLVPNENTYSSAFASQVFLLLGTFNTSLWQDNNGLAQGEVAILDTNTGTWTRILPSGDPDASGNVHFPGPREGSSALSFSEGLVGSSRNSFADTIVFGGQDANGTFLSELWLLRGYAGSVTSTNPTWTGFGNGQLQTGVNADGSGVRVSYITECASLLSSSTTVSNPPESTSGSGSGSGSIISTSSSIYNTSFLHKLLTPLSLVILLPILLFFRWMKTALKAELTPERYVFMVIFVILAFGTFGVGVAGFVLSFTTISNTSSTQNLHLKTTHGIAGLILFLILYGFVPFLYLASALFGHRSGVLDQSQSSETMEINDKLDILPPQGSLSPSFHNTSPPSSPRQRTTSWDAFNALRPSTDEGLSIDSTPSATPQRGFEILNRPNRSRKASGTWPTSDNIPGPSQPLATTRALGEIDWLLRRRAVHAVGELDYVITQVHNAQFAPSDFGNHTTQPLHLKQMVQYPKISVMILRFLLQVSILGLSIVTLMILWSRASRVLFVVFLTWLVAFYVMMIVLAWNHYPTTSLLTASLQSLRGHENITDPKDDLSNGNTPRTNGEGPYTYHRPPYRLSTHADEMSYLHAGPMSVETDGNDDDIDEDTRQRVIEEEMERRDVSIVTVPRRKLWVANPS